ncbi:hypothetical protein [Nocardia sp. NPDC050435]|uniref:hypothetical protein n=1 Tax=Nocardia sp. NPDC050435 TaxID=3155040 RepID=UPI0033F9D53A
MVSLIKKVQDDVLVSLSDDAQPVVYVGYTDPARTEDRLAIWIGRSDLDGTLLVQIDTLGPERVRVNVNDGAVYDAAPDEGDHHFDLVGDYFNELTARFTQVATHAA